ncbi:MAG: (Fe-S)-binding protein [Methanomassiliicoccales archaeon]
MEQCTSCGKCIEVSPLLKFTHLEDIDPKNAIEIVLNYVKSGKHLPDASTKAYTCSSRGRCSMACERGLDPLLAFEAIKSKLAREGLAPQDLNQLNQSLRIWKILAALQAEFLKIRLTNNMTVSRTRRPHVLFLGFTLSAFLNIVDSMLDVLGNIKEEFVVLQGGNLCCGFPYGPACGLMDEVDTKARELISTIKSFNPEKVIFACAGCYRMFTEIYPKFLRIDFRVQHLSQFLLDRLGKVSSSKPSSIRILFRESCMSRRTRVSEHDLRLPVALPGVEIVNIG